MKTINTNIFKPNPDSAYRTILNAIYYAFWAGYIAVLAFLINDGREAEFFWGLFFMACVFMHTISKPTPVQGSFKLAGAPIKSQNYVVESEEHGMDLASFV